MQQNVCAFNPSSKEWAFNVPSSTVEDNPTNLWTSIPSGGRGEGTLSLFKAGVSLWDGTGQCDWL